VVLRFELLEVLLQWFMSYLLVVFFFFFVIMRSLFLGTKSLVEHEQWSKRNQ